jgi:penicillin-binding protein 1C
LWQLVAAYRALARGGRFAQLSLTPADPLGDTEVLAPGAAFIVSDILADRAARAGTFGLDNTLALPFPASVKTGTSKDMRDNWCIGYTDRYTVGVWVGNFDGAPMRDVSGVSGAAPVWARIMRRVHADGGARALQPPDGVQRVKVRFESVPESPRKEWFINGTAMRRVAPVPSHAGLPRIVYPGDGMILALDADIPVDRQRLFFSMRPSRDDFQWRLDGATLVDPESGWPLSPGRHHLQLVDANGVVHDHARFTVRGRRPCTDCVVHASEEFPDDDLSPTGPH